MFLTGVDDEEPWHSRSDRRAVGGAGAADRRGPAALQGAARQPAGDDRGHPLAAPERRQVAEYPRRARALVEGGADPGSSPGQALHPLGASRGLGAPAAPGPAGPGAWCPARDDLSGRHQHPGSPEGGRCGPKRGSQAERDTREALGRSRGGYGTKACVIADGLGRAVAFILAPGQAHELPHAVPLLRRLPGVPQWVVADRGLTSHAFREHIWNLGARPAIPSKRNEDAVACPDWITPIATTSNGSRRGWKSGGGAQPPTRRTARTFSAPS